VLSGFFSPLKFKHCIVMHEDSGGARSIAVASARDGLAGGASTMRDVSPWTSPWRDSPSGRAGAPSRFAAMFPVGELRRPPSWMSVARRRPPIGFPLAAHASGERISPALSSPWRVRPVCPNVAARLEPDVSGVALPLAHEQFRGASRNGSCPNARAVPVIRLAALPLFPHLYGCARMELP
jgi:hypothetical protein